MSNFLVSIARQLVLCLGMGLGSFAFAMPAHGLGTWETTLRERDIDGDGLVDAYYDSALDLTWLKYSFIGRPSALINNISGYSIGGLAGWRLPENDLSCSYREIGCVGGELHYLLWTEFGGYAGVNLNNSGDFLSFGNSYYLESVTQGGVVGYWAQNFYGDRAQVGSTFALRGLAVRDGDVVAAVVPEPSIVALLLVSLFGMGFVIRNRFLLKQG